MYLICQKVKKIQTYALVDCEEMGYAFIDSDFAGHHEFCRDNLEILWKLDVIDGCSIECGHITYTVHPRLNTNSHKEDLLMFVTKLGHYLVVLRIPWLQCHDPTIS
jgi:hypothetical protein